MLRPRAATCGSVLGQVRLIVRRAFPLPSSQLQCHIPGHARHLSSSDQRGSSPPKAGRNSPISPGLKEEDVSPVRCSFVDQPCDMRSHRQELIRQVKVRFPWVSVKMPMYGPLFREDISLYPSSAPEVDKYLDDRFNKHSSTIMRIPEGIDFDREHILRHKVNLIKEFDFTISLAIKDRNVFLTAHKSELQKLKSLAEDLILSEFHTEVISNLNEETYTAVKESSHHLIPKELEQFAKPVLFDEGSIVMKGNRKALTVISDRVKQLIKYQSDPVKDSLVVPKTLLTARALLSSLEQEKLSAKFPSVTVLIEGGRDDELLISGQTSAELDQFKEWFQDSFLRDYHTKRCELDKYQTTVAKRLLASHLNTGTATLSQNSDEGSSLELSFYKAAGSTGPENILLALQNVSTIEFDNPVISSYLKVNGRELLPGSTRLSDVTAVLNENAVSFFGGTKNKRKKERDKMEEIVSGLFIIDIALPHQVFKNMVVGRNGMMVRGKYPGVFSFVSEDGTKITIVADGGKKEMAEKFEDYLRKEIDGLEVVNYSKSKASSNFFRLDDPKLKSYAIQNQISVQKVPSSDPELDSWLIYGKKEGVRIYMDLLHQLEQDSVIGKVTKQVQATDYAAWHSFILYAREINESKGTMKCLYDDHLRSSPGQISLIGQQEEVESAYRNFLSLELQSMEHKSDNKIVSEVSGLTLDDLRIASGIGFSYPNTKISTNAAKTGLLVSSYSQASVELAREYIEKYFGMVKGLTFSISARNWVFLKQNWDSIKVAVERICKKSGVRYKRHLAERTITLYGLPANTTTAKEDLDSYFLKRHRRGDVLEPDVEAETVEIDTNKLEAILDPDVGNFRRANANVSVQALLGKMGSEKSYLKLKSTSNNMLRNSITNLRRTEAEISLKNHQINDSTYELAKIVNRASPNYGWLFPNSKRKVRVKLDKDSPHFNIAYKSSTDLEAAERMLEKHLESLECLNELDIPTKKLGDVMKDITKYTETLYNKEQYSIKVFVSETENKILVFGKEEEVLESTEELTRILSTGLEGWDVFEVQLDGCNDVETAVQIRTQILKLFPYLMVDRIPEHGVSESGDGGSESGIVLRISTLVSKLEQYPATKIQLGEMISQMIPGGTTWRSASKADSKLTSKKP